MVARFVRLARAGAPVRDPAASNNILGPAASAGVTVNRSSPASARCRPTSRGCRPRGDGLSAAAISGIRFVADLDHDRHKGDRYAVQVRVRALPGSRLCSPPTQTGTICRLSPGFWAGTEGFVSIKLAGQRGSSATTWQGAHSPLPCFESPPGPRPRPAPALATGVGGPPAHVLPALVPTTQVLGRTEDTVIALLCVAPPPAVVSCGWSCVGARWMAAVRRWYPPGSIGSARGSGCRPRSGGRPGPAGGDAAP